MDFFLGRFHGIQGKSTSLDVELAICSQGALAKAEPVRSAASTSNSAYRRPPVPVRVGADMPLQGAEHRADSSIRK